MLLALYEALFKAPESDSRPFDTPVELYPKVIIAGFGRFGQIVGRILVAKKIAFTALEANQTQVDFFRRFGNQIYYGDASRLELLRAAHAENAEILVLAIDDVETSVKTAELVRKHFPQPEDFRPGAQSPACISIDGFGGALHDPRDSGFKPRNDGTSARITRYVEIEGIGNRASISRPRRSDHGQAACREG